MKKYLIITISALLFATACNHKTHREFRSADNSIVATTDYIGDDSLHASWQFTDRDGNPLVPQCDSLRVTELGPDGHPVSVCFYVGDSQRWLQFYSTMVVRSDGVVRNGLREGLWVFYFPNGNKQTEYTFLLGREEGPYKVFRENGIPYYIGQCREGRRVGVWEIYNEDGTLAITKDDGD